MGISTHVLNAVTGRASTGMAVSLACRQDGDWVTLAEAVTNQDGRIPTLLADPVAGVYRLTFETDAEFYPEVSITVRIIDPDEHYHVPLLLSPYAYSTYRGT
jgi:5-hydroxyisourate hydrolase